MCSVLVTLGADGSRTPVDVLFPVRHTASNEHMHTLERELRLARDLDVGELADAIESIGFECTRCGACCKGYEDEDGMEPHTATTFPDEARTLQRATGYDWRDVVRPMPYGLSNGADGLEGSTFEWALAVDDCGDCTFYAEDDDGIGSCRVHQDRPLVCRTYPFSVVLADEGTEELATGSASGTVGGTSQPLGEAVDRVGPVRAHECEGLGREIDEDEARELAEALKTRAIRELEEAIAVREHYRSVRPADGEIVVHDSEGAKRPDGRLIE